ncbi:hypothetical protein [Bartonella doshiae]|uniref:hypothetical protein n=1 Tax=Bartonella doshiae TaxID=33044 RepID=UPI0009428CB7|nr:hypothetical protein [Bartonella doshiae]
MSAQHQAFDYYSTALVPIVTVGAEGMQAHNIDKGDVLGSRSKVDILNYDTNTVSNREQESGKDSTALCPTSKTTATHQDTIAIGGIFAKASTTSALAIGSEVSPNKPEEHTKT